MGYYGFHSELVELLDGNRLTESFFQKIYTLVNSRLRKFNNKERWVKWMAAEDCNLIIDIGDKFVANYLMEENNFRLNHIFKQLDKTDNVDGLMVTLFKQFYLEQYSKNNPYKTHLRKRIVAILKQFEKENRIVRIKRGHMIVYGRGDAKGDAGESKAGGNDVWITGEDLADIRHTFPNWDRLMYNQEKKLSPVIGNLQLKEQVEHIFNHFSGWIPQSEMLAFFFDHLGVADLTPICIDYLEDFEGHEMSPYEAVQILENYESLSERRRKAFDAYYLNDRMPEQIASDMSLKKSTIYQELKNIKKTFQEG